MHVAVAQQPLSPKSPRSSRDWTLRPPPPLSLSLLLAAASMDASTASMGMPPMGSSRDDSALPSLGQRRFWQPGVQSQHGKQLATFVVCEPQGQYFRPHGEYRSIVPVTMEAEAGSSILVQAGGVPPSPSRAVPPVARVESPAVKHLAAIREKGNKAKSKTSRLRRAFSFGSPAEFKKVVNPDAEDADDQAAQANPPSMLKLHKEPHPDDLYDAEQERIAQRQEAAGIGNSIYSGGKIFTGSTDNISISSTASSASIMIRKMGRGMKKGTRSLVGLFRPKSVIGVPAADAALPEASQATLSMVTAEAEPVRKGILKTTNASPSATLRNDARAPMFELPQVPHVTDSPMSSAPSTPTEDAQGGHRRTGSVAIGSEDYFMSALRLRQDTKSAPGTPSGGAAKRNATFNPRLVFYDTWPSQEYDRRSEVATCNRLTPMLAQQIKEELNTFKMEMEVHENSKVYTHFF
ncbi:hypothetical protein P8C59_006605 [Phyllachora maydis]|uniref:Dihydroflavonal-4-reductase protein n=1 Tax=Phyllachora maydis TaxID=1825666 RepID=A0AAD9I7W8_9PEZI|nr:hypothetical protein P8C59_006605 [Phyllachora maydis]